MTEGSAHARLRELAAECRRQAAAPSDSAAAAALREMATDFEVMAIDLEGKPRTRTPFPRERGTE
jgi:hypothetical protein